MFCRTRIARVRCPAGGGMCTVLVKTHQAAFGEPVRVVCAVEIGNLDGPAKIGFMCFEYGTHHVSLL